MTCESSQEVTSVTVQTACPIAAEKEANRSPATSSRLQLFELTRLGSLSIGIVVKKLPLGSYKLTVIKELEEEILTNLLRI